MAKKSTPKTKSEILVAIAAAGEITKKQAGLVYDELLKIAYEGAKDKKGIMLLGKLIKVKRAKRTGRNPKTGEAMVIPAKTVAKFRLAKAAKDAVLA